MTDHPKPADLMGTTQEGPHPAVGANRHPELKAACLKWRNSASILLTKTREEIDKLRYERQQALELAKQKEAAIDAIESMLWRIEALVKHEAEKAKEQPAPWIMLTATSPSGKMLYCCTSCGRVSPTPDKSCKTIGDPEEQWKCSKRFEEPTP